MTAMPDMNRPVPAAPSPGSSARRAKLSEADRERISASVHKRFGDKKSKPERVGVAYRFPRGDEEWAYLQDGSLWCFRAGPFEAGVIVSPLFGLFQGKIGVVRAIVPSWGGQVRINVWFKAERRTHWDADEGKVIEFWTRPGPFWRREQLEIIGKVKEPVKAPAR